jgi:glutathione S-transferase
VVRLYAIPFSTNVERVTLALAHKGIEAEAVVLDPADRSAVRDLSGQDLVPVIDDGGRVVADSTAILEHLEDRAPDPPLYPRDPVRRTEMDVFIDWFDRVWKRPPNLIAEAIEAGTPDETVIAVQAGEMAGRLDWFEALLGGRDFLFGPALSAADLVAFPFLKYAARIDPADGEVFHRVLHQHQPLGDDHPRLRAWIDRIDALPRTPAV